MKKICTLATIWTIIYFVISMLIFSFAGYFICTHFANNNNILFCVSASLITLIFSLSVGFVVFIVIYKITNYCAKHRKIRQ